MKKMHTLLLSLCFILTSCGSPSVQSFTPEQPLWVSNTHNAYPDTDFLTGLGYGNSRISAENAAYSALAKYIISDISVNATSTGTITLNEDKFSEKYQTDKQIVSSSSISELVGLKIQETWYDGTKTYYALAVLKKKEATAFYTDKIRKNIDSIENIQAIAEKTTSAFESYFTLLSAIPLAQENSGYFIILTATDNNRRKMLEHLSPSPASLEIDAKEIAAKINLAIEVENDIDDAINTYFIEKFERIGLKVSQSNARYLLQCTLKLQVLPPQNQNIFVVYTLFGKLIDTKTKKAIASFSFNDRDGHTTEHQAMERALQTIKEYIFTIDLKRMTF